MTNRVDTARKLRGSGDRLFGNSFGGGSVKAMDIIRESINVAYDYDEIFDHLADLIDPVTNVVVETNEYDDVEYIFCGGCGEEFSTDLFNEHEITHCPYCGCRFRNPRQN